MRKKIQNIKAFVNKNNKYLMPLSLILGFVVDSLTLTRVDRVFENIVFVAYLFLSILGIFVFNYLRNKENKSAYLEKVYIIAPYLIQFMFGGLFSGFAVFYLRSGSVSSSWFFILLLLALMLGNDLFKKKYENFVLQITIFFVGLFFYLIFAIPIFVNELGLKIFISSGVASVAILFIVLYLFSFVLREQIKKSSKHLAISISAVFIFINILYFTNTIPPIPLALKTGGVYHEIYKLDGAYHVVGEPQKGIFHLKDTVHINVGDPVYAYSAVFAPVDITTHIFHHWQYFDPSKKTWDTQSRITFPISGGSLRGYRGYSYKTNVQAGKWRVLVETDRGQIIGTISFEVGYVDAVPPLEEKVL